MTKKELFDLLAHIPDHYDVAFDSKHFNEYRRLTEPVEIDDVDKVGGIVYVTIE